MWYIRLEGYVGVGAGDWDGAKIVCDVTLSDMLMWATGGASIVLIITSAASGS